MLPLLPERSGNHCSERPSLPSPGPPTTPGPHPQRPCDSDWGAPTSGLQFPNDSPLQPQIPSLAHPQARFLPCGPSAIPPLLGTPPPLRDRPEAGGRAHIDAEERSHAVQVVGVPRHGQDLGDDSSMGPLLPKLLHQFLQVAGGRLADGIDCRRMRDRGR